MRIEYVGNILNTRQVEDTVRATKKYTKGAFTRAARHPMQGEDFPSKVLTEYYEIYPDIELSWDMPARDAWAWVWGDTPHIDVRFHYNYTNNEGRVIVFGNNGVVNMLGESILGFTKAIGKLELATKRGMKINVNKPRQNLMAP